MPAGVTYWTGTWDPRQEAISKEIEALRANQIPRPLVCSLSSGQTTSLSFGDRVVRLSARHAPALRVLAPVLERQGDLTHVFGATDSWHLLRAVGRRPTIMTVVVRGRALAPSLYARVRMFAAESEPLAVDLRDAGIPHDRIRVVYPGVDLEEYQPGPPAPLHPFRILFASSPSNSEEFESRGIPLLVEVARLRPEVEIVLLWREWGDQDRARRAFARLAPPPNVRIEHRNGRDMASIYRSVHAIACCYADRFGKSCPNSVVEALACGVPALLSDTSDIAKLVTRAGAGMAVRRNPRDVAAASVVMQSAWWGQRLAARALAEREFDVNRFRRDYAELYMELRVPGQADATRACRVAPAPCDRMRL